VRAEIARIFLAGSLPPRVSNRLKISACAIRTADVAEIKLRAQFYQSNR